jgi:hypothetical protein
MGHFLAAIPFVVVNYLSYGIDTLAESVFSG